MSADHRKPVVAFVVLAFAAAAIIGIQRADAQAGRFLAAVIGTSVRVQGTLTTDLPTAGAAIRAAAFGPAFTSLDRALRGDRSEPLRVAAPDKNVRVAQAFPGTEAVSRPASRRAARPDVPGHGLGHGVAAGRGELSAKRDATRSELPRMMSRSAASSPSLAHRADNPGGANHPGRANHAGRADHPDRADHPGRGVRRGWARAGFTSSDRPSR